MRARVNVLCVIGFVLGVTALLATDSGSWFLDVDYWGRISLERWGDTIPLSNSFYDIYCYLFAVGSVLAVIGVMISLLTQVGGFAQLVGHVLLVLSLQSSRFADVAPFQELLLDGLWLSFVAGSLVALGSFVAIWWGPPRTFRAQVGDLPLSKCLLTVSPSDPSGTLRLNLVAVVGSVACGIVMFLPWFVVEDWVMWLTSDNVSTYQTLVASMGDGYVMVESSANIYFVVALVTLFSITVTSLSTLAGILHVFASSVFFTATYAAEVIGFRMEGLHVARGAYIGAGPFILIACGALILLSSWWRYELVLRATGARIERSSEFSVAAVRIRTGQNPLGDRANASE
jgi:hypothetical protein